MNPYIKVCMHLPPSTWHKGEVRSQLGYSLVDVADTTQDIEKNILE
jgi:hypothetical protein